LPITIDVTGHVAEIVINRPEVLNALDTASYKRLSEIWTEVRDNPEIWAAVVTGAGERSFCAGRDLKEAATADIEGPAWRFWQTQHDQLLNHGLDVWKPVIAAVNGYCLGAGMTLLMATDIRIAADHATFGLSEVKRSLLPNNGGTQRIVAQLPYPIAMEMLLTGDPIDAPEAYRHGLVNRVVPGADVLPTARAMAERICQNGPLAVRAIKELAVKSRHLHMDDGLRLEDAMAKLLRTTDDAKEGPRAFVEKRPAQFRGE
jgi:E-phenylitaconyl-CoA hydratase